MKCNHVCVTCERVRAPACNAVQVQPGRCASLRVGGQGGEDDVCAEFWVWTCGAVRLLH
jgi:hypothetical protein